MFIDDQQQATVGNVADVVWNKITLRLISFLFCCYVAAYLDRVNVGFAKLQMLDELHWSAEVYGLGAGIFCAGYFVFGVPGNILLHRIGARRAIAGAMLGWSAVSAATMFARSPASFYALRFLLGLAEAGPFPGIILCLTAWYPGPRRGRVIALFMTGIPVSGVVGAPFSGMILNRMSGIAGLSGWRWLFLLEAIPSVLMDLATLGFLDDTVSNAAWLTADQKRQVSAAVAADAAGTSARRLRDGFTDRRVWFLALIYLFVITGLYGVGFWLPTLIRGAGVTDPLWIGLLAAGPYAVAAGGMVLTGWLSDRARERHWHLAVPGLLGTAGWILSLYAPHDFLLAEATPSLATTVVLVTLSQFWCLPTAILSGAAAATGIAVMNSCGNLSGFAGPAIIGSIVDRTGSTADAVLLLAASLLIASLLVLSLPRGTDR